jgi:hypothetical protein
MSISGKARSAKGARAVVGSTILNYSEWNVELKGDDLDTTNFESQGFEQGIIGIIGCNWSLKAPWDAAQNGYDDPPGFYPRPDLVNFKVFTNVADNVFWLFPLSRVLSAKLNAPVRALVDWNVDGRSNGTFSLPTGSSGVTFQTYPQFPQ